MEKISEELPKEVIEIQEEKKISRKEAIKRGGYMALSVATTMILLSNPQKVKANGLGY